MGSNAPLCFEDGIQEQRPEKHLTSPPPPTPSQPHIFVVCAEGILARMKFPCKFEWPLWMVWAPENHPNGAEPQRAAWKSSQHTHLRLNDSMFFR